MTIVISGILNLATNYAIAQKANVPAGFIANPANNNNTSTGTTDPNYKIYRNLALGFNIKYIKNMTISERLNNTQNIVTFKTPYGKPSREFMILVVTVIPEINFLGQQYNLDQTVRYALAACCVGTLNGIPAYKVDSLVLVSKAFKNITSSLGFDGNPIKYEYRITYVTFRDGIGYWLAFGSFSQNRYDPVEKTMIDSFRYN
jgi:hypothetical protein